MRWKRLDQLAETDAPVICVRDTFTSSTLEDVGLTSGKGSKGPCAAVSYGWPGNGKRRGGEDDELRGAREEGENLLALTLHAPRPTYPCPPLRCSPPSRGISQGTIRPQGWRDVKEVKKGQKGDEGERRDEERNRWLGRLPDDEIGFHPVPLRDG